MGVRFTMWAVDPKRLLEVLTADEVVHAREDSLALQAALRRAAKSTKVRGIVQLIIDGHRRWWIGSFLESLRKSSPWQLNNGDVEQAEKLLSSLLRGWNCGTTVRDSPPTSSHSLLPIAPSSDEELRMTELSSSEFEFLRLFFDECLRDEGRRFSRPAGVVGVGPERDDDWDLWVREVLQVIAMTPLEVDAPTLVSFLG